MERGIKLPQSPSEWGFKGENYLLTIGINQYANWKPLRNAVKDVQDISKMLTERYQFETAHSVSLIDDQATEDNIREKLMNVKRSITTEDNLIIIYSGHGYYDPDLDEGYWVPANARKDNPSDYISNSDVLKWIRAIRTHHTLMLVDSCFSGTLVSQSRSEVLSEKYPSCRIFASGRKELVDDGVPGTNSPFAKAILSRLSHNTDRVMRASELIQSVTRIVESEAGQAPIEGRIKDAGDEGGEFVFHLKVTEDEIWASVIDANTAEEYSKYVDYYPDGHHVLEAKTKLSQLTDEDDWKRAIELSSPESLTQYLEVHPRGAHNDDALGRLEELEENQAWQLAKTRNTVSAFMDYLRKYPSGRFETLAKKNLDSLKLSLKQHEQDLVSDELEGIKDVSDKTVDNKEQYKKLINDAEGFYAQMIYEKCINKYEEALTLFQNHYVPDRKFIEQRIASAKSRIGYVEFLDNGKEAVTAGNYTLALEYFKKAKNIDDTPKIREWIKHAELKQSGGIISPSVVNTPSIPVIINKKKSSGISTLLWVLGFFILAIIVVVIYSVISSARDLNKGYDYISTPSDVPSTVQDESPATQNERSAIILPSDIIWGSWKVTDTGTYSAVWNFTSSGITIDYAGVTYSGSWQVLGFTLNVNVPNAFSLEGAPLLNVRSNYMECTYTDVNTSVANTLYMNKIN